MNTLVLGIGNPILTDDGIGIRIAQRLKSTAVDVVETSEAGLALLDYVGGYDRLIIIDSIKTEQGQPGELYRFELGDFKVATELTSFHGVDIATAFDLGRKAGYKMPTTVSIYAIAVKDNSTFGEQGTDEIDKKIPSIAQQIIEEEKL